MKKLLVATAIILSCLATAQADIETNLPVWAIGPFTWPADAQPVIRPDTNSAFICPMRNATVHWEAKHTFNPAAVVKDGKFMSYIALKMISAKALADSPTVSAWL